MPNIALTKNTGLTVNLPAEAIATILSTSMVVSGGENNYRSVILTTVGGDNAFMLAHSAQEVYGEICRVLPESLKWVILEQGDDFAYFTPHTIVSFDEVLASGKTEVTDENKRIVVYFTEVDGRQVKDTVNFSEENKRKLEEVLITRT